MAKKSTVGKNDLKTIRERIEVAKKYHKTTFEARDVRHQDAYAGKYKSLGVLAPLSTDNVVMNYLARLVNLKVAALAAEPPILRFRPRQPESEMLARVWEAYLPYIWREGDSHKQMKAALRDRYVYGRGWVAIDYRVETEEAYYEGERPKDAPDETVLYDNPYIRRVDPRRIFVDPEADALNWESAAFIVEEMSWPLERVKQWAKGNKKVNQEVANRLKGDALAVDPKEYPSVERGEEFRRATIWRYHEREEDRVVYLAKEEKNDPLFTTDKPHEFDVYPYEPIFGRPVLGKFDFVGEIENLYHWQLLNILLRSKMATMIRTARHLIQVHPSTTEEDTQAIEAADERVMFRSEHPPKEVNTTGFPPEFIQGENVFRVDYTEISGISELRRGLVQQGLDTATESSLLVQQASVGDRDEQAEWEDFNRRVARKAKSWVEQLGDSERIAAVSPEVAKGLQPVPDLVGVKRGDRYVWVRFTPQKIADESEVEILAGSMGAKEEALEKAQLEATARTIIDVAQADPILRAAGVDTVELIKMITRKIGANQTEAIFQAPQPLPEGMMPNSVRATPGNGQQSLEGMLKSVIQSATPGSGAVAGGGA